MYYLIMPLIIVILYFLIKSKNKTRRFIGTIGFCIIILIYFAWNQGISTVLMHPITIMGVTCIILGIFIIVYRKIRNQRIKNQTLEEEQLLERDINFEYTPSIASYLIEQNIKYKDLIADIMDLYARKIIDIDVVNNNGKKSYKFKTVNHDLNKNECNSNKYILKTLINNEENEKFDFSIWADYILQNYKKYNFSKDGKINLKYTIIFMIIISLLGAIIGGIIDKSFSFAYVGFIEGLIVATFAMCIFFGFTDNQKNKDLFVSRKGEKEIVKLLKLKEFMSQYTLLKDRDVEQILLYERYIPYAVALGINVTYKNTKFDIFDKDEIDNIIQENSIASSMERFGFKI